MRLRRRNFHATVALQYGELPVLLGLGPTLTFEMKAAEAQQLAVDIVDALERLQKGGGRC